MKKKLFKLLAVALSLTMVLSLVPTAMAANKRIKGTVTLNGVVTNNASWNDYMVYGWGSGGVGRIDVDYAHEIYSYIVENNDGTLSRIEYTNSKVLVETYSADYSLIKTKELPCELTNWGGFFSGADYNYLVFGQANGEESNNSEVLRVVKYDKNWNRVSAASVYGANTYVPFRAGSLRMTETGGKLYIHTCHQMYQTSDGLRHQANMTFVVNEASMRVEDCFYDIWNISGGYVSHSFNQFIQTDGESIFRVDHGDAYPRAVVITKCSVNGSITTNVKNTNALSIPGTIGANATGVSVGGFELSDNNCLIAGNSVDLRNASTYSASGQRNIFLTVTDKNLSKTNVKYLTSYTSADGVTLGNPQLVKYSKNEFLILWEEEISGSYTVKTVMVDGQGKILKENSFPGFRLSDCQPIAATNGRVTWYVGDGSKVTLYQIDPYNFSDIQDSGAYYYQPVAWAVEQGITSGKTKTTFAPDASCTRGEIVTFLWNAAGRPAPKTGNNPFADVTSDRFYYKAVLWAVENGIVKGTDDTHFSPNEPCTRAQAVSFIYRYAGNPSVKNVSNPFTDVASARYYYKAVLWAYSEGVVAGITKTTFCPEDTCTRGQIVTFLYRYLGKS